MSTSGSVPPSLQNFHRIEPKEQTKPHTSVEVENKTHKNKSSLKDKKKSKKKSEKDKRKKHKSKSPESKYVVKESKTKIVQNIPSPQRHSDVPLLAIELPNTSTPLPPRKGTPLIERSDKSETQNKTVEANEKQENEETQNIKSVSEKELGTPDTDEYFSNWEMDTDLCSTMPKKRSDAIDDLLNINHSWGSDVDAFELNPSSKKEKTYLQDDFSPFGNRNRNKRSMERSPLNQSFLEMPLNIKTTRKGYSRSKWSEEHYYSPNRNEGNLYSLFNEDSWERDDFITIKTEEIRLEEERRTINEERRMLEIEKKKLEELERQRYYSEADVRRQDNFDDSLENEERYFEFYH